MYRQVLVAPDDRELQRILYGSNLFESVQEYKLKTVTYGTKPASFLSTRCLVRLAENCADIAVKITIPSDFYVDDLHSGVSTEAEGVKIYE